MKRLALVLILSTLSGTAFAEDSTHKHMPGMTADPHMHHMPAGDPRRPSEAGQAAFAAIQEIVTLLEADPKTDWSKVDIEALRRHLIDMNNVTLYAEVIAEPIDRGARFQVRGAGAVRQSIRSMIFAHAAAMTGKDGWTFTAAEVADGATLTVTVAKPADVAKVRALGFIGIMARGMHHQAHHLMIASGAAPHK